MSWKEFLGAHRRITDCNVAAMEALPLPMFGLLGNCTQSPTEDQKARLSKLGGALEAALKEYQWASKQLDECNEAIEALRRTFPPGH